VVHFQPEMSATTPVTGAGVVGKGSQRDRLTTAKVPPWQSSLRDPEPTSSGKEVWELAYGTKMQIYQDAAGYFRWRLRAANGEKIATSGESFSSRYSAERAARNVIAACQGDPPVSS
jgi:uncharacterized protein YegP (UPF0339 family)